MYLLSTVVILIIYKKDKAHYLHGDRYDHFS